VTKKNSNTTTEDKHTRCSPDEWRGVASLHCVASINSGSFATLAAILLCFRNTVEKCSFAISRTVLSFMQQASVISCCGHHGATQEQFDRVINALFAGQ
jgi:hypothetical protein